jgi:hypothetical protein
MPQDPLPPITAVLVAPPLSDNLSLKRLLPSNAPHRRQYRIANSFLHIEFRL